MPQKTANELRVFRNVYGFEFDPRCLDNLLASHDKILYILTTYPHLR